MSNSSLVLVFSSSFKYLCSGSMTVIVLDSFSAVSDFRRQILTSKVGPRTERVNHKVMRIHNYIKGGEFRFYFPLLSNLISTVKHTSSQAWKFLAKVIYFISPIDVFGTKKIGYFYRLL